MDFSQLSDVQLDHLLGQAGADPFSEDYRETQALRAEKERRLRARAARPQAVVPKPPEDVDANLEAAATPIAVESTAGEKPASWRSMSDEDIAAPLELEAGGGQGVTRADLAKYGERYRQAIRNNYERAVAGRKAELDAGYQDPDQAAYNSATGVAPAAAADPEFVVVDGVRVPAFLLGDGKPFGGMYRLGDLNRAKEAANEARLSDMFSQSAQEDLDRYGDRQTFRYQRDENDNLVTVNGRLVPDEIPTTELVDANGRPDPKLAAQQDNLRKRRAMEKRQVSQNAALSSRPDLQALEADTAERKRRYRDMARLAGGSSGLYGGAGGNMGTLQALAMLEGVDPNQMDARQRAMAQMLPINPMRAQVEAAHNAQLTQLGLRVAQGQGFQQLTPEQRMALQNQINQQNSQLPPEQQAVLHTKEEAVHPSELAVADTYVSDMYSSPRGPLGTSSDYTLEEQQMTIDHLVNNLGYSQAKAQKIVDEIARKRHAQSWGGSTRRPADAAPAE